MAEDWSLEGMKQDDQNITRDWQVVGRELIYGVTVREIQNVPTGYGYLTELFRGDWEVDEGEVDQVFQSSINPGGVSAWHVHGLTTDRLFVNDGQLKIVLYDARTSSKTHGLVNEFRYGTVRPALIVIPPGVWHGVQNTGALVSRLVNIVDRAYSYERPDHYRLPEDTDQIPYSFQ